MVKFIGFPGSCPHFNLTVSRTTHHSWPVPPHTQGECKTRCTGQVGPGPTSQLQGQRHFYRLEKDLERTLFEKSKRACTGLSPLICCGTSPLRCSAKLSWVKTATELMVDGAPTHGPGEPLQQGWGEEKVRPSRLPTVHGNVKLSAKVKFPSTRQTTSYHPHLQPLNKVTPKLSP